MRICACALLRIMRIGAFCADYSYYAHIMRICAEYAYMRILRVYAPYGRGRKTLRIPRENGPGGRGLGPWPSSAPSLSCLVIRCISKPQDTLTYIYPTRSPRRPEGAADFPCLRQLPPPPEKNKNQGIEKTE